MIWRLTNNGTLIATGSYAQMLAAAERHGVIHHVVPGEDGRPEKVEGRGFYRDGCEVPPRLERGWAIVPVGRARVRRRAA